MLQGMHLLVAVVVEEEEEGVGVGAQEGYAELLVDTVVFVAIRIASRRNKANNEHTWQRE